MTILHQNWTTIDVSNILLPDRVHSKEDIGVESGSETIIDLLTYCHADCGITN
ncbi:MAG: hypothetical protein QG640_555 [Patescibacteria group bacterium]|nr:hypothetical protein [Patescibacteria group bacterium]